MNTTITYNPKNTESHVISDVDFSGNTCNGTLTYEADGELVEVWGEFAYKGGFLTHYHWFDEDGKESAIITLDLRTYDVVFNDDESSNSKGMEATIEECREYIRENNGTSWSYFGDYKGGCVSIVCNETGEEVACFDIDENGEVAC
jgi:hypothetical protein